MTTPYKAIVSSDWSECLSPSGPFDCLAFNHPEIEADLNAVFRQYTGNQISLRQADAKIINLLPDPISRDQIDAYLDASFATYTGVPDLIQWCLDNQILFMINSTGMIGYFQRVLAKKLLPPVPVLSAHPMIRYPRHNSDPTHIYELFEIGDKGQNTEALARSLGIEPDKIILIGDSGGDGPHFEWGAESGAHLIGSMTKPSLDSYCRENSITINLRFGSDYSKEEKGDQIRETTVNFMDLAPAINKIIGKAGECN